jgi:hypothetical protein
MGFDLKIAVENGQAKLKARYYANIGANGGLNILGSARGGFDAVNVQQDWTEMASPSASGIGVCDLIDSALSFTAIDFTPAVADLLTPTSQSPSASPTVPTCATVSGTVPGYGQQYSYSACMTDFANGISTSLAGTAADMPSFGLPVPSDWNIPGKFPTQCSTLEFAARRRQLRVEEAHEQKGLSEPAVGDAVGRASNQSAAIVGPGELRRSRLFPHVGREKKDA